MYTVYFLKSFKDDGFYIGCTGMELEKRLEYHNNGLVRSTKSRRPWKIVYYENYQDKNLAYKREYFLKRPSGYLEKLKIIAYCKKLAQPQRGPFGVG